MSETSQILQIISQGLHLEDEIAWAEAMRPELQRRMLALEPQDWQSLATGWPLESVFYCQRLCDVLSPCKHGRAATEILLAIVSSGPLDCLIDALEKLLAHQVLEPERRLQLLETLKLRLSLPPIDVKQMAGRLDHHRYRHAILLHGRLAHPDSGPRLHEACEYAQGNRNALKKSLMAACYYCQMQFQAETVCEYTDRGDTALCPYCGTDAVLAADSYFDLDRAGLQALNEYWFL
jgi:hypothetical protein